MSEERKGWQAMANLLLRPETHAPRPAAPEPPEAGDGRPIVGDSFGPECGVCGSLPPCPHAEPPPEIAPLPAQPEPSTCEWRTGEGLCLSHGGKPLRVVAGRLTCSALSEVAERKRVAGFLLEHGHKDAAALVDPTISDTPPAQPPRHHPGCGTWALDVQTGKPLPCSCTPEVMRPAQPSREGEAWEHLCKHHSDHGGCDSNCECWYSEPAERPRDVESAARLEDNMIWRAWDQIRAAYGIDAWVQADSGRRNAAYQVFYRFVREVEGAALSEPGTAKGGR